jgi:hypothetical protein
VALPHHANIFTRVQALMLKRHGFAGFARPVKSVNTAGK